MGLPSLPQADTERQEVLCERVVGLESQAHPDPEPPPAPGQHKDVKGTYDNSRRGLEQYRHSGEYPKKRPESECQEETVLALVLAARVTYSAARR